MPNVVPVMGTRENQRFHAIYDYIPDPTDDRFFVCGMCDFFCPRSQPEEWEAHAQGQEHTLHPDSVPAIPVNAAEAVPVESVNAVPLPPIKAHCRTCHEGFADLKTLRAHRAVAHPKE